MRVDEPMLSMVAARRRAQSRSGASVSSARQAPFNSSIAAIKEMTLPSECVSVSELL